MALENGPIAGANLNESADGELVEPQRPATDGRRQAEGFDSAPNEGPDDEEASDDAWSNWAAGKTYEPDLSDSQADAGESETATSDRNSTEPTNDADPRTPADRRRKRYRRLSLGIGLLLLAAAGGAIAGAELHGPRSQHPASAAASLSTTSTEDAVAVLRAPFGQIMAPVYAASAASKTALGRMADDYAAMGQQVSHAYQNDLQAFNQWQQQNQVQNQKNAAAIQQQTQQAIQQYENQSNQQIQQEDQQLQQCLPAGTCSSTTFIIMPTLPPTTAPPTLPPPTFSGPQVAQQEVNQMSADMVQVYGAAYVLSEAEAQAAIQLGNLNLPDTMKADFKALIAALAAESGDLRSFLVSRSTFASDLVAQDQSAFNAALAVVNADLTEGQ